MTTPLKRISLVALVAGLLLASACLVFTYFLTKEMSHVGGRGDPAGAALGLAFVGFGFFLLFVLLTALMLTAGLAGAMPASGRMALVLLAPAAFVAINRAFELLHHPTESPGLWPLLILAAAPTLIVVYCLWALIGPLRARVPARVAGFGLLGALGLVAATIFPLEAMRHHESGVWAARVADFEARLAATPDDAALPSWIPFLDSGVYSVEETARAKILALQSRQRDAEAMLARNEFPLSELSRFDLDPTPALCRNAHASLARRAAALALKPGETPNFDAIADEFFGASRAIQWLVSMDCASDAEARQWEALGRSYGASDIQVSDLVEARDPGKLGATLYNDPPKVSMLSAKTPLRAWLYFAMGLKGSAPADRPGLLASARALDHRNADALAWLNEGSASSDRFVLLHFLPQLDLETTPALCAAALNEIGQDLDAVYKPTADAPLPFHELGERLGEGDPLVALAWLAENGCDADAQLSAAQDVMAAYQPSPERETMAATFAKLKRRR